MAKRSNAPATPAPVAVSAQDVEPINIPLSASNATSHLFPEDAPPAPEPNVPHGTIPADPNPPTPAPAPAPEPPAAPAAPAQPPASPAPAAPAAPSDETFLEDLLAKSNIPLEKLKVRLKVDGQDQVMSYEEAKMRVQLKEHLNLAAAKLGDDRRAIADERRKFQEEQRTARNLGVPVPPVNPAAAPNLAEPTPELLANPFVSQLLDRVTMLEGQMQGLNPVLYDANRQRVANELKAKGFPDFLDYMPRIQAFIGTLQDPARVAYYDSDIGSVALYHELKSRDLMEQMAKANRPPAPTPAAPVPPAAPPANAPIVTIDGGNPPAQAAVVDNYDAQYQDVFERWKQTRDRRLLVQLLQMRGAVSPA